MNAKAAAPKTTTAVSRNIFDLQPGMIKHNVLDPGTDEPTNFVVHLISMDDESIQEIVRRHNDQKIKAAAKGKSLSAEDIENHGYKLVSSAIVGWEFLPECTIDFNGERPEYTPGMALNIVKRARWLLKQLDDILGGESQRFFQQ